MIMKLSIHPSHHMSYSTSWIIIEMLFFVLSQRSPPTTVLDLFSDLRDGARLLDLLEVMSGQRMVSDPP
jgi:hypothetical protein